MRALIGLNLCGWMAMGCVGPTIDDEPADTGGAGTSSEGGSTESGGGSASATESGSASASDTGSASESGDPTGNEEAGNEEGSPTSSPEDTGDPTGDSGSHCDVQWECTDEPNSFACGTPAVCDTLVVNDPSLNEFDEEPFAFMNPEAATCILESLGAGVAATHRIEAEPGQENNDTWELEAFGDGTIVVRYVGWEDKCFTAAETWAMLQAPDYFSDCLAAPTEEERYACMTAPATAECVEAAAICP